MSLTTKEGRALALEDGRDRIHAALQVIRVQQFFRFFDTVVQAEQPAWSIMRGASAD